MTSYQAIVETMVKQATAADQRRDTESFLDALGSAIGAVANVVQVAGWVFPAASTAAGLIAAMVGDQPKSDPALTAMQNSLVELIHGVHGLATDLAVETITVRVDDVQTTLDLAAHHGVASFPDLGQTLAHDAIALVRDLGSRVFWVRPHFDELDVASWESDGALWPDGHPPLAPDGQVFDPQLIHAAYVRAISMWLAALAMVFPAQRPAELDQDLPAVIAALDGYRQEWINGLRTNPAPRSPADVVTPVGAGAYEDGAWTKAGNLVGAFDVFTAARTSAPVWPWLAGDQGWDSESFGAMSDGFAGFLAAFALGGAVRRKALYVRQGIGDMWAIQQHLRRLSGVAVELVDPVSSWSLRELNELSGATRHPTDPAVVSTLDVLHTLDELAHRPPRIPGATGTRSLRDAIDAATP